MALLFISVIVYQLIAFRSKSPAGRLRWRSYFIIPLALAALALGWLSAIIHCPPSLTSSQRSGQVITGRVNGLQYTDFSMRMTIDVIDSVIPPCRVLLSTRGCDYRMRAGDVVAWDAALQEINTMGNPDEMDYATYLLDTQGLRYQQHLPLQRIKIIGYSPTLITRMANLRRNLSLRVFNSRLSPGAQRFVNALLLGDNSSIDRATKQEFSAAGVAHVLALSGLHMGFIAFIIWCLLFPLDYLRLKKLRHAFTLAAIILFALFTGMSPSVTRATVMIGCVLVSTIFYRRSISLNALALAALAILVFSPSSLFSVGFQLSFITVAAVLLFARLPDSLKSRHQWVNYLSSTILTSLVAILATIALTAHYFHTVSLMSVVSNLLILPVLPVFMVLGALFLLVTSAGLQWNLLDQAIDTIYRYIHWSTASVNAIPGSHVGGVYVSACGVAIYFVVMILVVLWFYRRHFRYLLAAECALAVLLAHSLWMDYNTPRRGLVIFNSFSSTPLLYYDGGKGYVWAPDDEENDSTDFSSYYSGFLARHHISQLVFVPADSVLHLDGGLFKPPYAHLMGRRLMAVSNGKWKNVTTTSPIHLDDIIVTKRFHGTAAKLKELYRFERLIISGAMYDELPLVRECDSLAIPYVNLAEGAIHISSEHQ